MFFVMKKLLPIFALSFLLLCGCNTIKDTCTTSDCLPEDWEQESQTNEKQTEINDILKDIVMEQNQCLDDGKLFVDIAVLWSAEPIAPDWATSYFLVANWECYKIDERWNLIDTSGFGNIPTTIDLSQDENWEYHLEHYRVAEDWTEYDNSVKKMFNDKAYKIRKDGKYAYINDKTLLEQAEEFFNVKIIPDEKQEFECKFCDKLRYYNYTPEDDESLKDTNELHFNYISENNWKNTIYFWADWTFEAKWSRDAWKWTWVFWKDENTVIVSNENLNHVYDRYIITNVDENNLNTILEIIQK